MRVVAFSQWRKRVTLNQNLMVLGCLRNQIGIMPDYPPAFPP
jgi:hypothetical protein